MSSKMELIQELRKAMIFYRELGFEYLPVTGTGVTEAVAEAVSPVKEELKEPNKTDTNKESTPDALGLFKDKIGDCRECGLSQARKNIIFGEGRSDAGLMFIGEGPGSDEDIQARPFVGDAGKLLIKLIEKLGMKREDVYIANIVKCRPPYGRNPEKDEIASCMPFVEKQIDIIKPRVIVCLGKVSANALLGNDTPISRMRGTFYKYRNIPVMPTFHPAYLLRSPKDKWLTWDDMQKVLEILKKTEK